MTAPVACTREERSVHVERPALHSRHKPLRQIRRAERRRQTDRRDAHAVAELFLRIRPAVEAAHPEGTPDALARMVHFLPQGNALDRQLACIANVRGNRRAPMARRAAQRTVTRSMIAQTPLTAHCATRAMRWRYEPGASRSVRAAHRATHDQGDRGATRAICDQEAPGASVRT